MGARPQTCFDIASAAKVSGVGSIALLEAGLKFGGTKFLVRIIVNSSIKVLCRYASRISGTFVCVGAVSDLRLGGCK